MFNWLKTAVTWVSGLSGNSNKTKALILVFVLIMIGAWATKCHGETTLNLDSGSTYLRGGAPVLGVTLGFPKAGPIDTDYECGVIIIGNSNLEGKHEGNQVATRCMMVDGFKKFDIGLGVAYLWVVDDYNGSHVNFNLMMGYNITPRMKVMVMHFSNLGTTQPNIGRDLLLGRYRF